MQGPDYMYSNVHTYISDARHQKLKQLFNQKLVVVPLSMYNLNILHHSGPENLKKSRLVTEKWTAFCLQIL